MKTQESNQKHQLIKVKSAASYLSISERKLWDLAKKGIIPIVRLGRATRYDIADLDSFINKAKGVRR